MTERDRQRIERGIGKQTAREPKKEIVYHVCISITIYVFEDLNLVPIVMGGFRTFCY